MHRTQTKSLSIASERDKAALSKGQKAFNKLVKDIEKKRARLIAWETAVPPYQQKYSNELTPLVETSVDLQVQVVVGLDRASEQKGLTKTERQMIAELISEMAAELIQDRDDPALKAAYNKHSSSDYDQEEAEAMQGMKLALEEMLNIDLGDDVDLKSTEDILQRTQAQLQEKQAQFDADQQAADERRSKRKKSAKQLAQETRQQEEEQQISQSIREVYRKLASALHPDREADPEERERKTALMQRANQAYQKNNLLQLLELQLELEHIDQSVINNLSEERLKHYNKILKEQLAELEQELFFVEGRFRAQFDINPFANLSPETLLHHIERDIAGVKTAIRSLEQDLLAIADIKKLKAWLKNMRRQFEVGSLHDFDDCPF